MGEDRRHVWVSRNNMKYFSALQLTEAFKGFLTHGLGHCSDCEGL